MVLAKNAILDEIKKGNIKIEPFRIENLGPGSYDLTLGNKFRIFTKNKKIFGVTEKADYEQITRLMTAKKSVVLKPKETILGVTKEKIILAENICGWLQGRSRFARLGLMVHITASFVQPGSANNQVLEMFNAGPVPLAVFPGVRVAQIVFDRTEGKAKYAGRFSRQREP